MAGKGKVVYGAPELFAADMTKLINDTEFSDVTFIVGEEKQKILAHKVILSSRCNVFRAMFAEMKATNEKKSKATKKPTGSEDKDGKDRESSPPLVLPDVRAGAFMAVIEFIYSNSCSLTPSTVVDVLATAIEYDLDSLASCCVTYISDTLSVETVCEAVQAAIAYGQPALRAKCMEFIEKHTKDVLRSKSFVELSEETLSFILDSDNLQVDEKELLASVKEWGTVNSVVAGKTVEQVLSKVIQHVRFPLLDEATLTRIEKENESNNIVPMKLVAKAWRYHATKKAESNDKQYTRRLGTAIN